MFTKNNHHYQQDWSYWVHHVEVPIQEDDKDTQAMMAIGERLALERLAEMGIRADNDLRSGSRKITLKEETLSKIALYYAMAALVLHHNEKAVRLSDEERNSLKADLDAIKETLRRSSSLRVNFVLEPIFPLMRQRIDLFERSLGNSDALHPDLITRTLVIRSVVHYLNQDKVLNQKRVSKKVRIEILFSIDKALTQPFGRITPKIVREACSPSVKRKS